MIKKIFNLFSAFWVCFLFLCFPQLCSADELIVEPEMGRAPLLNAINQAQESISLVMYGFTDEQLLNALVQQKAKRKKIKIILENNPYRSEHENDKTIAKLNYYGIEWQSPTPVSSFENKLSPNVYRNARNIFAKVFPPSPYKFKNSHHLIHQKTLIVDANKAIVMTFNFTHSTFKNQRNFALVIHDPKTINEIQKVFSNDWNDKPSKHTFPNLIWSPDGSRDRLLAMISNAQKSLKIYAQNISDYRIIGALAKASRGGIKVEILTSANISEGKMNYLNRAGVMIRQCNKLQVHAKVFIIDKRYAVIGSINLTSPSLDKNRELSVMTTDQKVVDQLNSIFNKDWDGAC